MYEPFLFFLFFAMCQTNQLLAWWMMGLGKRLFEYMNLFPLPIFLLCQGNGGLHLDSGKHAASARSLLMMRL